MVYSTSRKLVSKGRHDAHAWAMAVGLVPSSVEAGQGLQPVPGEAAADRDLGKTPSIEVPTARQT